jgi:hypothetical protein
MTSAILHRIVTDQDLLQTRLLHRTRVTADGCWEWQGSRDTGGYGMISWNAKYQKAHRVSYQAFTGKPIPAGMVVCHNCDNPRCINPNHLRIGTMKENMADRDAKGRRDVKGEQIGTSKLTAKDVFDIRASELSLSVLAAMYGVDKSNVHLIRAGKSWKHLLINTADLGA